VDVGGIDLEILDGNADGNQGPPKPPAKGGMSGVAFDRAIREKMEQQKKAGNNKRPADIDSDDDDQPPPQPTNQKPSSQQ
jgi:nucleoid-associated protein YgaU